jgi:hypothetical protein
MFDSHLFLLLSLGAVFPRAATAPRSRGIGFLRNKGSSRADITAVDFFLVSLRAGCARPAVATGGLGSERRLDATHVEEPLASVTLD